MNTDIQENTSVLFINIRTITRKGEFKMHSNKIKIHETIKRSKFILLNSIALKFKTIVNILIFFLGLLIISNASGNDLENNKNLNDNSFLKKIAELLMKNNIDSALKAFFEDSRNKAFPNIAQELTNLKNLDNIILDSLKNDVDKTIVLKLKKRKLKLTITSIKGNLIKGTYMAGKAAGIKELSIKDLDDSEIIQRLLAFDEDTGYTLAGIKATIKGKHETAAKYFQKGGKLATYLLDFKLKNKEKSEQNQSKRKTEKISENHDLNSRIEIKKLKINMKITKAGTQKNEDGRYVEQYTVRLNIKNTAKKNIKNYIMIIYIVGQFLPKKKTYKIFKEYSQKLNIKKSKTLMRKFIFTNTYNNGAELRDGDYVKIIPKSGYKYYTWFIVIKDENEKIQLVKVKLKKFKKEILAILNNKNRQFDNKGILIEP